MTHTRTAAVAGVFYPDDPAELEAELLQLLQQPTQDTPAPKALIVPHAGYIYSGPIAASAYALLHSARERVHRVILLGPAHRLAFRGLAASSADRFQTPLGMVEIDRNALDEIAQLPQVRTLDAAHAQEHSLEVHLPFLQTCLSTFKLVPLVVGDATYEDVAEVLERLWDGPETLIVISSDLSHYHDYATCRRLDTATSHHIESLQPEQIDYDHACGRIPIGGLLLTARQRGMHVTTLDLRNSGDTAGPRDRVVGYGAYRVD